MKQQVKDVCVKEVFSDYTNPNLPYIFTKADSNSQLLAQASPVTYVDRNGYIQTQKEVVDVTGVAVKYILSVPFFLTILAVLLAVTVMSFIYLYHFKEFKEGDNFVGNISYVYIFSLFLITVPFIFTLFS